MTQPFANIRDAAAVSAQRIRSRSVLRHIGVRRQMGVFDEMKGSLTIGPMCIS